MIRLVPVGALVSILPFLAACASTDRPLMPTPTLYYQPPVKAVFGDLAPERRRPRVKLFFALNPFRLGTGQQHSRLNFHQRRRHYHKIARQLDIKLFKHFDILEILLGDMGDGYIIYIYLIPANEIQKQVERTCKHLEIYTIIRQLLS